MITMQMAPSTVIANLAFRETGVKLVRRPQLKTFHFVTLQSVFGDENIHYYNTFSRSALD